MSSANESGDRKDRRSDKERKRRRRRSGENDDERRRRRRRRSSQSRDKKAKSEELNSTTDKKDRRRRRDEQARARDQPETGGKPTVHITAEGDNKMEKESIEDFLKQWSSHVSSIELNVKSEGNSHQHTAVVENTDVQHRIIDFFNSSRGKRYLTIQDMPVTVCKGEQTAVGNERSRERRRSRDRDRDDKRDRNRDDKRDRDRDDKRDRDRRDRRDDRGDRDRDRDRRDRRDDRGDRDWDRRNDERRGFRDDRDKRGERGDRAGSPRRREDGFRWRRKSPPPLPLLSEEFPDDLVVAFDSTENKKYSIKSDGVLRTEGAISMINKEKEDGMILKRTICHHYKRDGGCRFGGECSYVHVKADAEKDEVPISYGMLKGAGKGMGMMFGGKGGKGYGYMEEDIPDVEEEEEEAEEDIPHYDCCLLVRDVDRDTDVRGIRRMTEADFQKMWCEITGFVTARLYRTSDKTKRYGGSYGVVTFASTEDAVDALSQTFGCGLNVSFYGVEEMIEEASMQQQLSTSSLARSF